MLNKIFNHRNPKSTFRSPGLFQFFVQPPSICPLPLSPASLKFGSVYAILIALKTTITSKLKDDLNTFRLFFPPNLRQYYVQCVIRTLEVLNSENMNECKIPFFDENDIKTIIQLSGSDDNALQEIAILQLIEFIKEL